MKKYIVIGNPIEHSSSPKLHNHWIKKNKINAVYDKKLLNKDDLEGIIYQVKKGEIDGINITVPFKKLVIPFLDELSTEANESQSVNTIYKEKDKKVYIYQKDIGDLEGFKIEFSQNKKDKMKERLKKSIKYILFALLFGVGYAQGN